MLIVPLGERTPSFSFASRDMETGAYMCGLTKRKICKECHQ